MLWAATLLSLNLGQTGELCRPVPEDTSVLVVAVHHEALWKNELNKYLEWVRSSTTALFLPKSRNYRALTLEQGYAERQQQLTQAKFKLARAEALFQELDDQPALALIAEATAELTAAQQEPGAIKQLARAHLLAASIYLARGRSGAVERRLHRVLDLMPNYAPESAKVSARVLAELAAQRGRQDFRSRGDLQIELSSNSTAAIYIDGRYLGRAPGYFPELFQGNHLVRVSTENYLSYQATVKIDAGQTTRLAINLQKDPELAQISQLSEQVQLGNVDPQLLRLLSRRAGASRTLVLSMRPSGQRIGSGQVEAALQLHIQEGGTLSAARPERLQLERILYRLFSCKRPPKPLALAILAPGLLGQAPTLMTQLVPAPEPEPIWERPWFWFGAACLVIVGSGLLVGARSTAGPPTEVKVTLIPRP